MVICTIALYLMYENLKGELKKIENEWKQKDENFSFRFILLNDILKMQSFLWMFDTLLMRQ